VTPPPTAAFAARTHRLIASRFPAVGVFDDVAGSENDLRAAFELEALTNDRLVAAERLRSIPGGEVALGQPGASLVMAAFLHASPLGGRFTDHRLGAWYASCDVATAIEETVYHQDRRLRASAGGFPNRIQMRELIAEVDAPLVDLRGLQASRPALYHPTDYTASRALVAARRWPFGAPPDLGVVYGSVRRAGGTNVCIFRPATVSLPVIQGEHYEYVWDARGKLDVLKLTNVARLSQPK
jgi:hypothetical protein